MQGKYRKITVDMNPENDDYRFWKHRTGETVCYVESYKDKRAVFFQGSNLLPGENYHLILIGKGDGQIEHQNFGPLHTEGNGEIHCYRTFGGTDLENYAFCLLCADKGNGQMEIVCKGTLFQEEHPWSSMCQVSDKVDAFTKGCDETGAQWYRAEEFSRLPAIAQPCIPWMKSYGHYIVGRKDDRWFLGVPGRFLQKEQPLREEGVFLLWQPIRGGEAFFDCPERMTGKQQEKIFGYWIAEIDTKKGRLWPV